MVIIGRIKIISVHINNFVSIKVYQQLHKDYNIALSDIHIIAKRTRNTSFIGQINVNE